MRETGGIVKQIGRGKRISETKNFSEVVKKIVEQNIKVMEAGSFHHRNKREGNSNRLSFPCFPTSTEGFKPQPDRLFMIVRCPRDAIQLLFI